jgi:hypothetical protein
VEKDTIWFTASHNDHDQVFAAAGGRLFKADFPGGPPPTGQYGFHAAEGKGSWSTFTAAGFILDTASLRNLQLTPLPTAQWDEPLSTHAIHSLEKGPAHLLDKVEAAAYPVKKYPADFRLLNFHSWRPYITDPDYTFSVVSENVLNTLQSEIYVDYNRNEKYKQVGINATYGALFPWITAGWDYIFDRNYLGRNGNRIYWDQLDAKIGLSVPLHFTRHLSFTNLQVGSDFVYNRQNFKGAYKDSLVPRNFAYLNSYISFSHQSQQARQQIYPRLAQSVYLNYHRTITDVLANQFLASAYLYLPGIAFTNSLVLGGAFQQRDKFNSAGFSNGFPFSRGYTANNFYSMYRFSVNYHFPLVYPDRGLGNIVYFQRIRANGFYDYTHVQDYYVNGSIFQAPFRSYGTEIYFDTKWWNQLPISFGIRYSRLIDPDILGRGPNQWEFILPINLLSHY